MALGVPWLRQAFGGLHWQLPLRAEPAQQPRRVREGRPARRSARRRWCSRSRGVGIWTATRGDGPTNTTEDSTACRRSVRSVRDLHSRPPPDPAPRSTSTCSRPPATRPQPLRSYDDVRQLVRLAQQAGAEVISTTVSFRTMQPVAGGPITFDALDRTIGAARSAGLRSRLQLVGMPDWALDDPQDPRQAPRSEAELARWTSFVTNVLQHVDGKVDYLEVWNEPNDPKWWPTGPDPVEFTRLHGGHLHDRAHRGARTRR